jgi:hypothetical protein
VDLAPSVRIRAEGHLLGVDISRTHCNNPLFENADRENDDNNNNQDPETTTTEAEKSCFSEDGGNRVCALPLRRSQCLEFSAAWGLADVFC